MDFVSRNVKWRKLIHQTGKGSSVAQAHEYWMSIVGRGNDLEDRCICTIRYCVVIASDHPLDVCMHENSLLYQLQQTQLHLA